MSDIKYEHFSHRFKLKLDKFPARATDRVSRLFLLSGIVFGLMLCALGLFYFMPDFLTGSDDIERGIPKIKPHVDSFVAPEIFNAIIFLTGAGVVLFCLMRWVGYKKIYFDGSSFTVKLRPFGKPKEIFTESLYNYLGVRLRVKFYQFGIFNKNKYIIELYHRDTHKTIPLYITTKAKGLRRIWQDYAQKLYMPGITISEKGMVSYNFKDMAEPYADVVKSWHLPKNFAYKLPKPAYMTFKSNKSGEKMVKISQLFLDAYSFLNVCTIGIITALSVYAGLNYQVLLLHLPPVAIWGFFGVLSFIVVYAFLTLISKDIIIITHDKIYVFRKILFFRLRGGVINIKAVKGIDINYTPTSERYYLAIVTRNTNYIIGSKLPVEGLRWLRAVLINEIIGN